MSFRASKLPSFLLVLAACGGGEKAYEPGAPKMISVENVDWNPGAADVGTVAAVAEVGDATVVYSNHGALVFNGGAISAKDDTVVKWAYAATIPAGDATRTSWAVGLDDQGRVLRLAARMQLEDVSDRYGLKGVKVLGVVNMGQYVGFALENEFAIADGATVTRYDGALHGVSGGPAKMAGVKADGSVLLFDARSTMVATFQVKGATETAIDAGGRLVVAGSEGVWVQPLAEVGSALNRVFDTSGAKVHGMVLSGSRVWFAFGTELGSLDPQGAYKTQGANVPADATLFSSPSGDTWALSSGKLTRFTIPVTGDEAVWRKTVQPVYVRVCADCHAPGGTSGIDLSSYASWSQRKALVYDRVLVKKNMPQGRTLDDADMQSISAWSKP